MTTINITTNSISIDDIELVSKKENIDENSLNSGKYFCEFNSKHELITISVRFVNEFSVNGKVVNFDNINNFLIKNKALFDDKFIIIPKYSMSLYIDFDEEIFLEVLIYSSLVKSLYEKGSLKLYENCVDHESPISLEVDFIPFMSIGEYDFGESEEYFLSQTKLSYHEDRGVNNKKYYNYKNILFRFDKDKLSQVYICNPDIKIMFNQININTIDGINSLLGQYPVVKSRSHNILLDIGVAVKRDIRTVRDIELYFFDKSLIMYWKNIHRPITSW